MARHGGKRPGAGRPKGSKNKTTIAREAVAEILDVDERDTLDAAVHKRGHSLLLEMERIAHDPTQSLAARIAAARVALPFLLPRREPQGEDEALGDSFVDLIQERRLQLSQMRAALLAASETE
jgi:hypothetical protein